MPIEIRELNIKVNVNQDMNQQTAASPGAGAADSSVEREALIKEAVEETLRIIDNKKER